MKTSRLLAALAGTMLVTACGNSNDAAEDRMETAAEASVAAAGTAEAALGLTERQLLDAEIVDASGVEFGDVEAVLRNATGQVDRLLVEVEDSNPDKYVHVPVAGLTAVAAGMDWNLTTTMTRQQFAALPAVPLGATVPPPAASQTSAAVQ